MQKQGRFIFLILVVLCLSGCLGGVWTGANMVYDRHNVYKKLGDYRLFVKVNNVLAVDRTFNKKNCVVDIAIFNGDILIAGHLPSTEMLNELRRRLSTVKGYRHLYIEMNQRDAVSNTVQDSWITAKIRSQIFADDSIDPNTFKVTTSDGIVYLMGDVRPVQAEKVVQIARKTQGVVRVVKIFNYLVYQKKAA